MNPEALIQQLESSNMDEVREQTVTLLDRYEMPLYNFLLALTRDRDLAQDCVQQAFLLALEHLRKGKSVNSSWLYKVARNKALDDFRRRAQFDLDSKSLDSALQQSENVEASKTWRALAQLAADEREILHLYDVDGFSAQEIGHMVQRRPGAIRMRVLRAREHLKRALEEQEMDNEASH